MRRQQFAAYLLMVLITCSTCSFLMRAQGSDSNPISITVEPTALPPLHTVNSTDNQLEIPASPSAVGDNFTVQIHLRNATLTNIGTGVSGIEVHFYFGNILTYAVPTQFTNKIGQADGVLNGPDLFYGIPPAFCDAQGNPIQNQNVSLATYFDIAVSSSDKPWNAMDGLIATITFRIIKQPNSHQNESTVTLPLCNDLTDVETVAIIDPNLNITMTESVPHSDIAGTLVMDSDYEPPIDYSLSIQTSPSASGFVNINVNGTNQTFPYNFLNGTVVQAIAFPNPGWLFSSWTINGTNKGSMNPLSIIVTNDNSITANFTPAQQPLNQAPVQLTAEPSPVTPLNGVNSTPNTLEILPGQPATGNMFAIYLHLRNATVENIPGGVQSINISISFKNISEFAQPISFDPQMLGAQDGVLNPDIRFSLPPGFYDSTGNLIHYPYDNATNFSFSAYSTGTGWNGNDGVLAVLTFQITKQPQTSLPQTYALLSFEYSQAELTDSNGNSIPHQMINSTVTLDANYHHISLINATTSKSVVGQGFDIEINVTMANLGNIPDNFVLTIYANASVLGSETVSLTNGNTTTIMFQRNSTPFAKGVYAITAQARIINGQMNQTDNTIEAGKLTVTIPGDIDGNGKVGLSDLVLLTLAFGSRPGQLNWNANADIDCNGVVDKSDLSILVQNYGNT